jgi:hypothetical protein
LVLIDPVRVSNRKDRAYLTGSDPGLRIAVICRLDSQLHQLTDLFLKGHLGQEVLDSLFD